MSTWNRNRFSVYTSDEKDVLGLIEELGTQTNENSDALISKTDLTGDHKGSWQGLSKPTLSDEGMRATVEKHITDIDNINGDIEISKFNSRLPQTYTKLYNKEKVKFISFGDSITLGSRANGGGEVTTLAPYPKVLQDYLINIFSYGNITHENKGLIGEPIETISNLIINTDLTNVDFITVLMGTNDCLQVRPLTNIKNKIDEIINKCAESKTELILMTIPPILNDFGVNVKSVNNIINSFKDKCCVIDVHNELKKFQNFKTPPHLIYPDLVHLADDKYKLIADIIIKEVFIDDVLTDNQLISVADRTLQTNGTRQIANTAINQMFMASAFIRSNLSNGYMRIYCYSTESTNINIYYPKGDAGASAPIKINGITKASIDCYSKLNLSDNIISLPCDFGLNIVEVLSSEIIANGNSNAIFINGVELTNKYYVTPNLLNGWTQHTVGDTLQYCREDNKVFIKGLVKPGTINNTDILFQLEEGIRPKHNRYFNIVGENGIVLCVINTFGGVNIYNATSEKVGGWLSFDNVCILL